MTIIGLAHKISDSPVAREEAPQRRHRDSDPLGDQRRAQLDQGDVRSRLVQRPDARRVRLDLRRARVAALRLGRRLVLVAMKRRPKRAAAARRDRPPDMAPTIRSRRPIDNGLPICPGLLQPEAWLNQTFTRSGIPRRFTSRGNCSSINFPRRNLRDGRSITICASYCKFSVLRTARFVPHIAIHPLPVGWRTGSKGSWSPKFGAA